MSNEFYSDGDSENTDPFKFGQFKSRPRRPLHKSNLTRQPPQIGRLDEGAERDLIRDTRRGDEKARRALFEAHHGWLLWLAKQAFGPPLDDRVSAAIWGFFEAVNKFDLKRNSGRLSTYAFFWIRKRMLEVLEDWHRAGVGGSRAYRHLISNPNATAEEIAVAVDVKLTTAQAALAVFDGGAKIHYSTTGHSDDGDRTRGWDYGSDAPSRDRNPVPIEPPKGWPWWPISEHTQNISRGGDGRWWVVQSSCRYGLGGAIHSKSKRVYGSLFSDRWTQYWERRQLALLKAMGRQAYADYLIERDNRPTKYPPRYSYGPGCTFAKYDDYIKDIARPSIALSKRRGRSYADIEATIDEDRKAHVERLLKPRTDHQTIQPGRGITTCAVRPRNLKRVHLKPTPQPRHLKTEQPCPQNQLTNLLQATRFAERHCSPLQPELPKPLAENSESALSNT